MLATEFYAIIQTEETTVQFLKMKGLLPTNEELPHCHSCGSGTKFYTRKDRNKERIVIRCKKKGCQKTQSVRQKSTFFTYKDKNGKCNSDLSLAQILELTYYWCHQIPQHTIKVLTGRGTHTISDWMNLCQDIPVCLFRKRVKMGGKGTILQVDEFLLCKKMENHQPAEMLNPENVNDGEENVVIARNYGQRIEGPWVFGMCLNEDNYITEARYFIVDKRDRTTLHRIICDEIEIGTEIHSDEWLAYRGLDQIGYIHKIVNHSQKNENLWGPLKLKTVKKMHEKKLELLSSYLAEQWWRIKNKNQDLFEGFLNDIKEIYAV